MPSKYHMINIEHPIVHLEDVAGSITKSTEWNNLLKFATLPLNVQLISVHHTTGTPLGQLGRQTEYGIKTSYSSGSIGIRSGPWVKVSSWYWQIKRQWAVMLMDAVDFSRDQYHLYI